MAGRPSEFSSHKHSWTASRSASSRGAKHVANDRLVDHVRAVQELVLVSALIAVDLDRREVGIIREKDARQRPRVFLRCPDGEERFVYSEKPMPTRKP